MRARRGALGTWWASGAGDAVFAALLGALVYLNTLASGFVLDDGQGVTGNRLVTGPFSLRSIFVSDFWGYPTVNAELTGTWRPLATLAFALEWRLGGGQAWAFHLVSVILHAAACWAFHRALASKLPTRLAALAASALFAVHTLHTENVAAIVGQADVAAMLGALAVWSLHRRPGWRPALAETGAFTVAMLFKESSVAVLACLAGADLARPALPRRALALRYALLALVLGALSAMRLHLFGTFRGFALNPLTNPLVDAGGLARALTPLRMFLHGLGLLVAPVGLLPDHGVGVVRPSSSVDAAAVGGALALVALVALAVRARREAPRVSEAVAILVLPGLLSVNALVLLSTPFAERFWYLPSAGACLLWGEALAWFSARARRGLVLVAAVAPVVAFIPLTLVRNAEWATNDALLTAAVSVEPRGAIARYNLGYLRMTQGRWREAFEHCSAAARSAPDWGSAHGCRATMLEQAGRTPEALQAFRQMTASHHTEAEWWVHFARFLSRHGRRDLSLSILQRLRVERRWSDEAFERAVEALPAMISPLPR